MIGISVEFTAGRYHATPWGKHVNEGVPEWPPSSWRILRALVASWKRTADHLPEKKVRDILLKLLDPPYYHLPQATMAHTRHYMPWDKNWTSKRHAARTLIFNTFVAVAKDEPVNIYWPNSDLTDEETDILEELAQNLPYLGRSESWCRMSLIDDLGGYSLEEGVIVNGEGEEITNSNPMLGEKSPPGDKETQRVLIPEKDNISPKTKLDDDHPLLVRTSVLRDEMNQIDPPAAKWVQYTRPKDCFKPEFKDRAKESTKTTPIIARYALDCPSLPPITKTIELTSITRAACMSNVDEKGLSLFSGKNEDGDALKSGHEHAHYIASDEDGDGMLDHLTIYAERGFKEEHQKALNRLTKLYGFKNRSEISMVLLGTVEKAKEWPYETGLFGPSKTWRSATPYLLSRHPKKTRSGRWKTEELPIDIVIPEDIGRFSTESHLLLEYGVTPDLEKMQREGPIAQLLLSIERRGLPEPRSVEPLLDYNQEGVKRRWLEFKRYRQGGKKPASGTPYGFKINFDEKITGPLLLGHNSHFGLGSFVTEE